MSSILDFYSGKASECRFLISDVWSFSFQRLEEVHDYIQWIFPLDEPSAHNLSAPVLTKEDIETFRAEPVLRWRLMASVHTYMRFLHFTATQWVTGFDHNHLRITRMLKCLMLMGMEVEAQARFNEVMLITQIFPKVNLSTSIGYWRDAINPDNYTKYKTDTKENV